MDAGITFIALDAGTVAFLLVVGFVGGMVSGFIGSGGAFVLTPAMMSMGVPGIVAVASNMCHKFPKALVGAIKRARYGQVDVKLGLFMGASAEAGVLVGAQLQQSIKASFGEAGSNLYVSAAFVVVLAIVGGFVLRDALASLRPGAHPHAEPTGRLARRIQSIEIPGTMVYFESLKARVSWLVTVPLGFATGLLAATIAVGGFIGVPSMMYVLGAPSVMASATELVIAFIMGLGGTIKFAWDGFVDVRLAMIILAGSLFGIQLGAIGTTYVRPAMIKLVMAVIMLTVLVSRALVVPVYLSELAMIPPLPPLAADILRKASFATLVLALVVGAGMVLWSLARGMAEHRRSNPKPASAEPAAGR
ncbi:MAG: sulfite exporter TauE/SafE family protein [Burkholderiales bacterium]